MGTITDKDGYTRHTAVVNGQPIEYRYCPRRFGGETFAHDHFEFLSFHISETGYRSHFVNSEAVDSANGFEQYAEIFCKAMFKDVSPQLDLFAYI